MTQNPETETDSPTRSGVSGSVILLAAVSGVALLIVGVLLGALLYGQGSSGTVAMTPPSAPAPQPSAANPAPPAENTLPSSAPEPVVDTVGVSDPAVTEWHEGILRPLGLAVNTLTLPAPERADDLRSRCEALEPASSELIAAPAAPNADVEKTFRAWAKQLNKAVKGCLKTQAGETDDEYLRRATAALSNTGPAFDEFGRTLDLYFDFSTPAK